MWTEGRKAIAKALKPTLLQSKFDAYAQCVDDAVAILEGESAHAQGCGGTVDVAPVMHALALDMVAESLFGERLGALRSQGGQAGCDDNSDGVNGGDDSRGGSVDPVVEAFCFAETEMVRDASSMFVLKNIFIAVLILF